MIKRLLIAMVGVVSVMLFNSTYAFSGSSGLKVNMSGSIQNTYYLCVNNSGCYNVSKMKGKTVPILMGGSVENIILTDIQNDRMYPQKVSSSCHINVQNNQTLTVSGSISHGGNQDLQINNMRCSVVANNT